MLCMMKRERQRKYEEQRRARLVAKRQDRRQQWKHPTGVASQTPYEDAIVRHVTELVAPRSFVLHEIESEVVHIDVHVVPPAADRDYWFLFTTGMSARPMAVPAGLDASRLTELTMRLPRDWVFDPATWARDSRWFWPIRELRAAARHPHRHRTWLGNGHTITSPERDRLDASTMLSSMLLIQDLGELGVVDCDGVAVDLLTLWPLYSTELDFVLDNGSCALIDSFVNGGGDLVIDCDRPIAAIARQAGN
jgi:hypothetical protein